MTRFITIYRPTYVNGISNGQVTYRMGDLRAKMLGVRVPVLWALNQMGLVWQT